MANGNDIRRFSKEELEARRGERTTKTDLAAVRAKSEAELERDIAGDPDFRDVPPDWHLAAEAVMPTAKRLLSLRLDAEVIDWFRQQGPGYQTRMNAVLRAFVDQATKRAGETTPAA